MDMEFDCNENCFTGVEAKHDGYDHANNCIKANSIEEINRRRNTMEIDIAVANVIAKKIFE